MQSSQLTLYWSPLSQPSRAVHALLLIADIPFNTVVIDLSKGEQRTEDFKKINPRGVVPAIQDGDFTLGESTAILKYLCNTQPSIPGHYWPKNDDKRALVDQFLEYNGNHFRDSLHAPYMFYLIQKLRGVTFEAAEFESAMKACWKELDTLEVYLGQHEGDFIVGKEPTIADIQIFSDFTSIYYNKIEEQFAENDKYPRIKAWKNKMLEIIGVKKIFNQWHDKVLPNINGFMYS
ncbi:hypothetical protein FGO68_gene12234 [Halteria grandinella]|uniref:Glutathione S-transferase n=1 Tax=Halteria grandinella TaxID=5974 RepID=A0A8J8SYU3_HALGN|nr:hypothetical protein FGO68_gene12234 [Halteria grandinella]